MNAKCSDCGADFEHICVPVADEAAKQEYISTCGEMDTARSVPIRYFIDPEQAEVLDLTANDLIDCIAALSADRKEDGNGRV